MPIESSFSSLRSDLDKIANRNKNVSFILTYDEAYERVINDPEFKESISTTLQEAAVDKSKAKTIIKDKAYFREKKASYKFKIGTVVDRLNLSVRGMDRETLLEELTEDIFGYKVLKDLYYSNSKTDPYGNVTDIFCLAWDKIYYESSKSDTPIKYERTFRSPKDYRDWIERMLREAGKSMLDSGENKVIDFDLYEDRYNAISKSVAPNDFSITMRKHSEDHVTLDMILSQGGMSQDVADLYGLLIAGECNTIMAGVTGSGKTTSMRAVLDYYVTKLNKRMLVCEDTRELFPKNDHTLELQTSPGTTKASTVSLGDLVTLALRQKPKYIIVGEVRAAEAEAAVKNCR